MWVAGVDGCRAGWIVAFAPLDGASQPQVRVVSSFTEVIDAPQRPAVIAVDMPIGLPQRIAGSGRMPEQLVRPLLGDRQSSVFAIPAREAVEAPDYGAACRLAAALSVPPRKVSKQGFMLFPRIRELDALLRARPGLTEAIFEVHPEVAFWSLNGERPLALPKKVKGRPHPPGLELRRGLLAGAGLSADVLAAPPPAGAGPDDLLDALAGLAVARAIAEGRGRSFPEPPDRDEHGLPVAIWTLRI